MEPKGKTDEEKIVAEASKITETEEGGVTVSVEDEATEAGIVLEKAEEAKKPVLKQDPLSNKVYAHDRILSNVQRSIEELKNIMLNNSAASTTTHEQSDKLDELDKLAQTDWKAAVGKIAEVRAR